MILGIDRPTSGWTGLPQDRQARLGIEEPASYKMTLDIVHLPPERIVSRTYISQLIQGYLAHKKQRPHGNLQWD